MHFSDRKHILRLAAQQEDIKRIFDRFAREAGVQLERWTSKAAPGIIHPPDVWLHNRVAEKRIEKLLDQLHTDLVANIDANTRAAWEDSNRKVDEMIRDFIADIPLSETFRRGMFTRNAEGLRAFMQRKHAGMNLSDRIWSVVDGARENMEFYLASGIAEGRPAALLSQDIRYILKEPDKRFRRVRNADGKLVLSQPMKDYHPGRGVYRSSYMNALRVGATETNIAYHESDHQRWQSLDFVLGVKVERSGTSAKPCPVCDAMKGTYPKGFKFLPWHPFCICHATPVMLSGQEFTDYLVTGRMPAGRVLRDMPAGALEYVEQHPSYRTSYAYQHNVPFFDKEAKADAADNTPAQATRSVQTPITKEQRERRSEIKETVTGWIPKNGSLVLRNDAIGKPIQLSTTRVKEWLNQPHAHYSEKNEVLLNIRKLMEEAVYLGNIEDKHSSDVIVHIFEVQIANDKSWLIVREFKDGECKLHSVSDSPTLANLVKRRRTL